jgi:hypothetical protein
MRVNLKSTPGFVRNFDRIIMHKASVVSCDDIKVVHMFVVYEERDLDLIGSDGKKGGGRVEDVSEDGVGEAVEACAGDVDESKGNWQERNGDSVSHGSPSQE